MAKSATTSQVEKKMSIRDELKARREVLLKKSEDDYYERIEKLKQIGHVFIQEFIIPKLEESFTKNPNLNSYSVTIEEDELSVTGYQYHINDSKYVIDFPDSIAKKSLIFAAEMAKEYDITAHVEHSGNGTTSYNFSVELD